MLRKPFQSIFIAGRITSEFVIIMGRKKDSENMNSIIVHFFIFFMYTFKSYHFHGFKGFDGQRTVSLSIKLLLNSLITYFFRFSQPVKGLHLILFFHKVRDRDIDSKRIKK